MKKVLLYCLAFVALSSFVLNNGSSFPDLVRHKLNDYANKNWPEKVYIHTDKPYYSLDEDLWFSTYLVNGISHNRSSKSTVVYVELINEENTIVDSKRLFVENLSVAGHFKIDPNWSPGNYFLRAYTNYMRNETDQVFFQKNIQIISLDQDISESTALGPSIDKTVLQNNITPELEFFPEGGYLVEDITTKVALKLRNPELHNYELPISIVDSEGTVLNRLTTTEFGMGFFYLKPSPDIDYFANINIKGEVFQFPLPKALAKGYGVNINHKNDELLIGLSSNRDYGLKNSYLMVHQRGTILYDKLIRSNSKSDVITIYTGTLNDGVTHITLFDNEGQPVCERLVFIENKENKVSLILEKNKEELKSREKVALELLIQNSKGETLNGNLSMSVRDMDAFPEITNAPSIKTWLLLNSDLRGKIENPGYFFREGESSKKRYLLDLVMMTNGWRRFTWQGLLEEPQKSASYEAEKGITISGTTKMLEPPNEETTTINTITFLGDTSLNLASVNSKKDGKFEFGPFVFYDSITTLIQSKLVDPTVKTQENYRDVLISINDEIHTPPDINPSLSNSQSSPNVELNDDFKEAAGYMRDLNLQFDQDRQLLEKVVLTARKKTKIEQREQEMEKRSLFGSPTRRVDVSSDQFLSKTQLRFVFQRFPGITVGGRALFFRGEMCRIFYNDAAVSLEDVSNLSPSEISFIDFYDPNNSPYLRAPGGVFVIYGKIGVDGTAKKTSRLPGIINFISKGFDSSKEFYSPDYSKDLDQMTRTDIRTTLYWEPVIRLSDEQPSKELSFYTCDMKGIYQIEIEGITDTGIPIHKIDYFSVN